MRAPQPLILFLSAVLSCSTLTFAQEHIPAVSESAQISELRKRAEAGDPKAQNDLGVAYRMGDGIPKDKKEAVNWYRKAARQNYADGLFNLGISFYNGDGVGVDEELAYAWLVLANLAGSEEAKEATNRISQDWAPIRMTRAERRLGQLYEESLEPTPANQAEAFKWYKKAADKKDSEAQYKTCEFLSNGIGIAKNEKAAFGWCEKSAQQYDDRALFALGRMYESGIGTQQDFKMAIRNYGLAAATGAAAGTYRLGMLYKNGQGVRPDESAAYAWFLIANQCGIEGANSELDKLQAKLSSKQQDKAKKAAAEWWQMHKGRLQR